MGGKAAPNLIEVAVATAKSDAKASAATKANRMARRRARRELNPYWPFGPAPGSLTLASPARLVSDRNRPHSVRDPLYYRKLAGAGVL